MYIIFTIILIIILISAIVALIAFITDQLTKEKTDHRPYGPYERYIKRSLDAFLSTGALIVFSPVLLITAILVRIKIGSPILFTQDRPGLNEKIFRLYKFRTMTDQRDENGNMLPDGIRLTQFGKILRATSIDELPELVNIIKGDMSIVGPRPLLIEYLPWYTEKEHRRHEVRPGLTGLAQINGRNNLDWDHRFETDVCYVNHISLWYDVKILFLTIKKVIVKENVSENTRAVEPNLAAQRREQTGNIKKEGLE